jgi:hypothetical protein
MEIVVRHGLYQVALIATPTRFLEGVGRSFKPKLRAVIRPISRRRKAEP